MTPKNKRRKGTQKAAPVSPFPDYAEMEIARLTEQARLEQEAGLDILWYLDEYDGTPEPEPCHKAYPCPCCGYMSFEQPPGSGTQCQICGWEDDLEQLLCPDSYGYNDVTLMRGQTKYRACGMSSRRHKGRVRQPVEGDLRDSGWRRFDPTMDLLLEDIDIDDTVLSPDNVDDLYYWRRFRC